MCGKEDRNDGARISNQWVGIVRLTLLLNYGRGGRGTFGVWISFRREERRGRARIKELGNCLGGRVQGVGKATHNMEPCEFSCSKYEEKKIDGGGGEHRAGSGNSF